MTHFGYLGALWLHGALNDGGLLMYNDTHGLCGLLVLMGTPNWSGLLGNPGTLRRMGLLERGDAHRPYGFLSLLGTLSACGLLMYNGTLFSKGLHGVFRYTQTGRITTALWHTAEVRVTQ